jgi:hypothetical protein
MEDSDRYYIPRNLVDVDDLDDYLISIYVFVFGEETAVSASCFFLHLAWLLFDLVALCYILRLFGLNLFILFFASKMYKIHSFVFFCTLVQKAKNSVFYLSSKQSMHFFIDVILLTFFFLETLLTNHEINNIIIT